ncbi:unnamed protein product [Brachionus calyciflorus]|uniref:Transmembrane protein 26 n=1 Tax=Brachionus calyciflorus TaxID=104777 RepID=A0A814AH79_9BILA|nr:unnamed protein product [Brachionus calyciflorus]
MRAFMRVVRALFIRLMFIAYMLLCIWRVTFVSDNKYYWLMIISVGFLLIETAILLWLRAGKEFRGILPSVLLFLSCVLPSIWIMCIDEASRKTRFQLLAESQEPDIKNHVLSLDFIKSNQPQNGTSRLGLQSLTKKIFQSTTATPLEIAERKIRSIENYSTMFAALRNVRRQSTTRKPVLPISVDCCDVKISYWFQEDNFQHLFHQGLMLVLVLSRWLITRSDINLNQRALILIISLATAADTLDFFSYLKLELVYKNNYLLFSVLLILTLSLLQFIFLSLEESFNHNSSKIPTLESEEDFLDEKLDDKNQGEKNEKFPFIHKHYEMFLKRIKGDSSLEKNQYGQEKRAPVANNSKLCMIFCCCFQQQDPIFFILLAGLILHDGSYLTFRIFSLSKLGLDTILSQSPFLIFFMTKNILIILTQVYKVFSVASEKKKRKLMENYREYMQHEMNRNPNFIHPTTMGAVGGQLPLVPGYYNQNMYPPNSPYRFVQVYNESQNHNPKEKGLNRSISSLSTGYFVEKNFKNQENENVYGNQQQQQQQQQVNDHGMNQQGYVVKQQQYDSNIMMCQNAAQNQSSLTTPSNPFTSKVGKALYGLPFLSRSKTSISAGQETVTNMSNGAGFVSTFRNNSFNQSNRNLKASKI